ncbi:abortive infection system antitoxin AbiGi family protein [Aquibacillus salsiterrae]|uniref:Abortive infection system antitoxin AbiGi family protein n=1 Tax=Aquibacillus salsiterrae TaxID=2950439 RepID=A0A9X3WB82_9BACI|nr:abortive infection system antitoxin AbiGi family protein [Aquibacillus salsiterrae]MDC3416300.1 abortive infection system antitoxin AbiGi family protein [Aquibacillus salsiterrae]
MKPRYYSNIYWHFTGGPTSKRNGIVWHHFTNLKDVKKNSELRKPKDAMNNLKSIIESNVLKATCTELISNKVETKKFCSVCDIPLVDLMYHKTYYGEYAIGFNAKQIHDHFHPVLYLDPSYTTITSSKEEDDSLDGHKLWDVIGIHKENPLLNFIKITNFALDYDHSFYGEREWRCLEDFNFKKNDVEAIIVPKEEVEEMNEYLVQNGYHNISVMSWNLIENI